MDPHLGPQHEILIGSRPVRTERDGTFPIIIPIRVQFPIVRSSCQGDHSRQGDSIIVEIRPRLIEIQTPAGRVINESCERFQASPYIGVVLLRISFAVVVSEQMLRDREA